MKKINPLVRNLSIFLAVMLVLAGVYLYMHKYMHRSQLQSGGTTHSAKSEAGAKATEDYRRYFGNIPEVGMIECQGLVIYFPSNDGSSYTPYPFFITTPGKRDRLIVRTMLAGLPSRSMGEEVEPIFPPGFSLNDIMVAGESLEISLKGVLYKEKELGVAAGSLVKTFKQFYPRLARASITISGTKDSGERHASMVKVRDPGPPKVLDAFLVREEDEKEPHEIRILFDRPVMINDMKVNEDGGKRLEGDLYLAEFSMAAVLSSRDVRKIKKGQRLSIAYSIHDFLGRQTSGEAKFDSRVEVHQ